MGEFVLPLKIPGDDGEEVVAIDDFMFEAASWTLTVHEGRPGHELHGGLDPTLLVGRHGVPEVLVVDVLFVVGDVDAGPGGRHPLHECKDPHPQVPLSRVLSGSNADPVPTTVQGYSSFMYITLSEVPGAAYSVGT